MREAARLAAHATDTVIEAYRNGVFVQEVPITGGLAIMLQAALNGNINGLKWSAHILESSSGIAGEERDVGADMLIHVQFKAPRRHYSKGVLVQAKRYEPGHHMSNKERERLDEQCAKMGNVTEHAYIFDYTEEDMRCGKAGEVAASPDRDLYRQCGLTAFDFFFELFKCNIGDHQIRSAQVRDLPVPTKLNITAVRD
jgi:hypothetical protein